MNRRGVLGLFGAGAMVGPTMAQEALEQAGIGKSHLSLSGAIAQRDSNYFENDYDIDSDDNHQEHIRSKRKINSCFKVLKKAKDNLNSVDELPHYINNVSKFDSDLATNKSLALSAKIRIQAHRNLKASKENSVVRAESQLYYALKRFKKDLKDGDLYSIILSTFGVGSSVPSMEDISKLLTKRDDDDDYFEEI